MNIYADIVPDILTSGGQSGADFGALLAAQSLDIPTGGYAPKGFRTEVGPRPALGDMFGLIEAPTEDYAARTKLNLELADAVILVARNAESSGSKLTRRLAITAGLPFYAVQMTTKPQLEEYQLVECIQDWLLALHPSILMFAGNRESIAPGIEKWTYDLVRRIFSLTA